MLESIINMAMSTFRSTFLTGDLVALLIAFGAVLVAAMIMRRATQIGSITLLALVLFAVGGFLRSLFRGGPTGSEGMRAASQFEASLSGFMGLSAGNLLAYFIVFMVLILVLFTVKSMLARG
jgi:hypothetical protein